MADRYSSRDGSVSPTTTNNTANTADGVSIHANNNGQRNSSTATGFQPLPAWHASSGAKGSALADPFALNGNNLRGAANSFQPAPDQLARSLRILSLGSVDDDGPTIVTSAPTNKNTAQEPIGTKGTGGNSPVRPKGCFSTDVNPDKPSVGGHYIMIQGLTPADIEDGIMSVIENEYKGEIRGKKTIEHGDDDGHVDMSLFIDDLRKSRKIVADLDSVGNITVSQVSHDWYATGGKVAMANSVEPKSMYVGQATFIAEFRGRTADFKGDENVWTYVKTYAESFGSVLGFDQNKAAPYPTWQFRVEYYKTSDAEKAISELAEFVKLGDVKGWIVSAKQYKPPSYVASKRSSRSSHNSTSSSNQNAAMPVNTTVFTSPTGRTAWYTDDDGNNHPLPPPRPSVSADRSNAEVVTMPPHGNELVRYDSGNAPRGQRVMRMDSRDMQHHWSMDSGFHETGENVDICQHDNRGKLADVAIDRILNGYDVRTTVMLRNVPNEWSWQDVKGLLDQVVRNRYNFMYLRIDFKVGKNVGYAFVNFENALDIVELVHAFVGKPWDPANPQYYQGQLKTFQLSYATIQGLDSLIDKFRNSSIMDEMIDYRPLLLQTAEEKTKDEIEAQHMSQRGLPISAITPVGERKIFPSPNNRAKKERSTANAALLGLFTPRNRGLAADRAYRSQYDRGTPAQLMEDASHYAAFNPYGPQPYMIAPPMANYTYGPPRGQPMYSPFAPGAPMPYGGGYLTAPPGPAMMPRTTFMPETPTRPHGNGGRPGFNHYQHNPAFAGNPGAIGPVNGYASGQFAGHMANGVANGNGNDHMVNTAARGHSSM